MSTRIHLTSAPLALALLLAAAPAIPAGAGPDDPPADAGQGKASGDKPAMTGKATAGESDKADGQTPAKADPKKAAAGKADPKTAGPKKGDPKKGEAGKPGPRTPKPAEDEGGRVLQDGELVSMLRGLLAQKERRIAGLLRELGAARTTARKEQLLSARAIENLTVARRRIRELETDLASARKALGETRPDTTKPDAKPGETKPDTRPGETKPDTRPGETKPDTRPGETKPDPKSGETKPDTKSGETKLDTKPDETKPDPKPTAVATGPRDPRFQSGALLDPDKLIATIDGEEQRLGEMLAMLLYNYGLDYLSAFIRIKLVEQEAARLKIHISEQERVAWTYRQLIRMEKQAGGAEKFREKLKSRHQNYENYEAALQRTAPYAIRLKRIIAMRRSTPEGKRTLEQIAAGLYEQRFGPRVSGLHIFWRVKTDAAESDWAKAWKHAESIHDKLLQGQLKFAKVAKDESDDENSAENGGKFGPVDRTMFRSVPVFNDVIFKLPRGGMRLLRSREGVHIVKVTKAEPATLSWTEAKRRLLEELIGKDPTEAEIDSLLSSLEKSAKVERLLSLK